MERAFVPGNVITPINKRDVPRVKHWNAKAISKILDIVHKSTNNLDDDKV